MLKLLLLDPIGPDAEGVLAAAVKSHIDVYGVAHADADNPLSARPHESLSDYATVDFSQPETAVSAIVDLAARLKVDGIVTVNEFLTPLATLACAELSLPGNIPEFAYAARNKIEMSRRLTGNGVPVPQTYAIGTMADLHELINQGNIEYPFVVKPAENAGSWGVSVVSGISEVATAYHHALAQQNQCPYGISDRRVVVQKYVDGVEYSIESVTQDAVTTHVCMTQKFTSSNSYRVDLGLCVPAVVDSSESKLLLAETDKAIAATGLVNCVSHTEVKIDGEGRCTIIEIAARLAGGRIAALVELALGVDLWKACADVALGTPVNVSITRDGYAAVRFLSSPRAGRLTTLANLPEVGENVPVVNVRRNVGDSVSGDDSSKGRIGYFIVTGPDAQAVNELADHLLSGVSIEVAP